MSAYSETMKIQMNVTAIIHEKTKRIQKVEFCCQEFSNFSIFKINELRKYDWNIQIYMLRLILNHS